MGSNGLISKEKSEVEVTSLSTFFEKMCSIYMSYGMSYDEFWYDSPYRAKFYLESYKLKIRQQDEHMWMQGMYIYEALCKVSPVLHAFSKKGTKPLPYSTKPYLSDNDYFKSEQEKEQQKKNEELLVKLHFKRWVKKAQERFKNKKE